MYGRCTKIFTGTTTSVEEPKLDKNVEIHFGVRGRSERTISIGINLFNQRLIFVYVFLKIIHLQSE